ncbi:MAG: hypothetical protein SCARUB_03881 [Candidatus Scalindua rubra]|uniref:Uncharacterized protein n=1 Tax=Candidatus Scalindua rubra TaxID=1872076 RepID=A0A1E3X5R0_9BACT|nr:MAG: hypothetical protein SCARUB_03881 [Candidatus Scalindua rubra]
MVKKIKKPKYFVSSQLSKSYDWKLYPDAERFLKREIQKFLKQSPFARKLAKQIERNTSSYFFDWVDHIVIPRKEIDITKLKYSGFEKVDIPAPKDIEVYRLTKTIFPSILITESNIFELALKPENIDHFVKGLKIKISIKGKKYSPYRRAIIHKEKNHILSAVERRGTSGFTIEKNRKDIEAYKEALKLFSRRERLFDNDRIGILEVEKLIKNVIRTLSPARTADAFFRAERIYWERRNKVAKHQRKRHDLNGLGWGNHDHHTFRSSRKNFTYLIRIFEKLGFLCRERFFAGEKAGWGAQVLEHPDCNFVVFADVDITEMEKDTDFSHKGLKETKKLGTIGLWVALHGESILQSGMHHMAARFNFTQLRRDLNRAHIGTMKPFSDFSFLKQAFTKGEFWKVEKNRLDTLQKKRNNYLRTIQNISAKWSDRKSFREYSKTAGI